MDKSKEYLQNYSEDKTKVILVMHGMGQSSRDADNTKGAISLVRQVIKRNRDRSIKNAHVVGISSGENGIVKTTNRGLYQAAKSGVLKFLDDNPEIDTKDILIIGFSRGAYTAGKLAIDPDFKDKGFAGTIMVDPPESGRTHTDNALSNNNQIDDDTRNNMLNVVSLADNVLCGSISGYLNTVGMFEKGSKLNMPLNVITDFSDETVNSGFVDRLNDALVGFAEQEEVGLYQPNDGGHTRIGRQKTYLINDIACEIYNNAKEASKGSLSKSYSNGGGNLRSYSSMLFELFDSIRDGCTSHCKSDGKYYTSSKPGSQPNIPLEVAERKTQSNYWVERANSISSNLSRALN